MSIQTQSIRGSLAITCANNRPQTQVESQISEIERELERWDKALENHSVKLQSVLRQEAEPSNKAECTPPEELLVPSADKLRTIVKRITSQRIALENMTDRVEA